MGPRRLRILPYDLLVERRSGETQRIEALLAGQAVGRPQSSRRAA
jgi:hypothetical protein